MIQVLYTDTNAIRAALGVTEREIADNQITDLNVGDQLLFDLESAYPDHAALVAAQNSSPTAEQVRLYKALIIFCSVDGAYLMVPQLQMLTAQKISDGDAEMQRFQKDNLQDTISRILSQVNRYRAILVSGQPNSIAIPNLTVFGTVQPGYDPVTNTGTNPSPDGQ